MISDFLLVCALTDDKLTKLTLKRSRLHKHRLILVKKTRAEHNLSGAFHAFGLSIKKGKLNLIG